MILTTGAYSDSTANMTLTTDAYSDSTANMILTTDAYSDSTANMTLTTDAYSNSTANMILTTGAYSNSTANMSLTTCAYSNSTANMTFTTGAYSNSTASMTLMPIEGNLLHEQVSRVVGPIALTITVLGTIGNILAICVMSRQSFKPMAISRIIRMLGVCDTLYLLVSMCHHSWFNTLIDIDIRSSSDTSCKTFMWFTTTSAIISVWMIVLLTIYRFVLFIVIVTSTGSFCLLL